MLGMSEAEFWRATLRELDALLSAHAQVMGGGDTQPARDRRWTVQEMLTWRR